MHNRELQTLHRTNPPQLPQKPALDSATLFGAGDEVLIVHCGETYRLRRTRQGKLILTK